MRKKSSRNQTTQNNYEVFIRFTKKNNFEAYIELSLAVIIRLS